MRLPLFCVLLLSVSLAHAAPPELDWLDMMPPEDQKALEEMPEIDHNTPEAEGFSAKGGLKQDKGLPAVMYSAKTVPSLNGKKIRLGGYPVPLDASEAGTYETFFLVPYPGACIHVPPPPPNQIVLVTFPKGFKMADIYTPIWVDGTLNVEKTSSDLAEAAYVLRASSVKVVEEDDL
ncbi:DUF3299 domain-containing protein [Pseudomonas matsuisoli]|uniref:DUF3299 domain-containing protein n=1 Tax=Pseudomonas matsuisoli TaxID=1515666 RepID=A0A917PRG5_9PSED|nr:DUF3299 domain-containing protein [Pseudomonas matsuisoli]GGJ88867.1 hypothetical protein GCM10009304_13070 [Pseudomonas matsuisoli]